MRRRIFFEPGARRFSPPGNPEESAELKLEELEAVRLAYVEKKSQEDAASQMGISQPTFSRVLQEANSKIASALVQGKAILIKGGDYMVEKGVPKMDGSGEGMRKNRGRGGCNPPQDKNARPCMRGGPGRGRGRRMGGGRMGMGRTGTAGPSE